MPRTRHRSLVLPIVGSAALTLFMAGRLAVGDFATLDDRNRLFVGVVGFLFTLVTLWLRALWHKVAATGLALASRRT